MQLLLPLSIIVALSAAGYAQDRQPGQMRTGAAQPYEMAKEETMKATVASVAEQTRGPQTIVALTVKIDDKEYMVALAPPDFLKGKDASFAMGDEITIKGIKSETPRGLMVRAREVVKGEASIVLLDENGRPLWMTATGPSGRGPGGLPPRQR